MRRLLIKKCFVPLCTSTSDIEADKNFFKVPNSIISRQMWFAAVNRVGDQAQYVSRSQFYCCARHFNIPEDLDPDHGIEKMKLDITVLPHRNLPESGQFAATSNGTTGSPELKPIEPIVQSNPYIEYVSPAEDAIPEPDVISSTSIQHTVIEHSTDYRDIKPDFIISEIEEKVPVNEENQVQYEYQEVIETIPMENDAENDNEHGGFVVNLIDDDEDVVIPVAEDVPQSSGLNIDEIVDLVDDGYDDRPVDMEIEPTSDRDAKGASSTTTSKSSKNDATNSTTKCKCIVAKSVRTKRLTKGLLQQMAYNKRYTIAKGRPTPELKHSGHFVTMDTYEKFDWLTGCEKLGRVFCWPCLFFTMSVSDWVSSGVRDFNNLNRTAKLHSACINHMKSFISLKKFCKVNGYAVPTTTAESTEPNKASHLLIRQNREVFKYLIDAVIYLLKQGLTLLPSNFTELIDLLSAHNAVLKNQVQQFKWLVSFETQNDLIVAIATVVENSIRDELKNTQYVSLIMDHTNLQILTMLRYVNEKGEICERFVDRTDCENITTLENHANGILHRFNCEEKIISLSHDASVLIMNKIQPKTTNTNPLFVPATVHRLSAILTNALFAQRTECQPFFHTMTEIGRFFQTSERRRSEFNSIIADDITSDDAELIDWAINGKLYRNVLKRRQDIMRLFEKIIEDGTATDKGWDHESYTCARTLLSAMNGFRFTFLLIIYAEIFPRVEELDDKIRANYFNVTYCVKAVDDFAAFVVRQNGNFQDIWRNTLSVCDTPEEDKKPNIEAWEGSVVDNQVMLGRISEIIRVELSARYKTLVKLEFLELFNAEKWYQYSRAYPQQLVQSYRNIQSDTPKASLDHELMIVFNDPDFFDKASVPLMRYLVENGLHVCLKELYSLLLRVLTYPLLPTESKASYQRLRNVLPNARSSPKLMNSIAVLTMEEDLLKKARESESFYNDCIDMMIRNDPQRYSTNFKYIV